MNFRHSVLFAMALVIVACEEKDNDAASKATTIVINATNSNSWKYFSFDTNDTLTITDPSTSDAWDLAFQRYRIRTNGGQSGSGQGCAANSGLTGQQGFDNLAQVADTLQFVQDDEITIAVQQGYATYLVNPELYNWFSMEMATQGTQIVPSDTIYVIKTAKGDYAKVWFKSYYSAANESGHITMQYLYQSNGTEQLE
ncbi:MAG: HmuY family protein [Bacteroidales bacterium]|nr:HmuY family protein [Bacteroidales bacterium]